MKWSLLCLASLVATLVCECSVASAAPPVIASVQVDRGRDMSEEGDVFYHERVWVTATDADGAGDVKSVTITDSEGGVHAVGPSGGTNAGWWEEDAITVGVVWEDWGTLDPPPPGPYSVTVADLADNSASLTTAAAPEVPEVTPELLTPAPNYSLITDTVPVFSWLEGVPGADNCFHLWDESTGEEIWHDCFGTSTSVVYNFDGNATQPELIPGHSYAWQIDAWSCEDCGVSDPRVSLITSPHAFGRFVVAPGPEPDPILPLASSGKLAYQSVLGSPGWDWNWVRAYDIDAGEWLTPGLDNNGTLAAPDWSPDGSRLLYVGPFTDPDWAFWMDNMDGTAPSAIPGILGWHSRWAPSGDRVVFDNLGEDRNVWVGEVDGSEVYAVAATEYTERYADWSPDGQWIAYDAYDKPDGQGVWIIRYDGDPSTERALAATGIQGEGYAGYDVWRIERPAWHPDGTKLAVGFSMSLPGGSWPDDSLQGIGVMPAEGGDILPVFVAPADVFCCARPTGPEWSPDGGHIAFRSGHHLAELPGYLEFEPGVELWVAKADGSEAPSRVTDNDTFDACPSWWAPNTSSGLSQSITIGNVTVTYEGVVAEGSTSIVVTDDLPSPPPGDLTFVQDFTYHIATTATISGTVTVAVDYGETAYPPVLGERLSLLLWDGVQWVDITTARDTAGYTITGEFLPGGASDWYVALALDRPGLPEVKVMFDGCTEGRPSGPGLFVADGDFSNPVRVTLTGPGTALEPECVCACGTVASALSPDGTRVVMERTSARTLEVMDLATLIQAPGQDSAPLTDEYGDPVVGGMPYWSPSGDRIVYTSMDELFGFNGIAVVNADGTDQHMIYAFPGPDLPASVRWTEWSPDGARILFQMGSAGHGGCHVYVLENLDDPGGAILRQLTADDAFAEDVPHWSPDGRHVVFSRSAYGTSTWSAGDIWVIDVETGVEHRLTDSPDTGKAAQGWCPYDGYVYFWDNVSNVEKRILPDGTGEETMAPVTSELFSIGERLSWLPTGVWIDGLNALPGESVTAKLGIADAENLAGVQAKVRYTGGSDTLTFDSILKAESILDWAMPSPVIGADVASFLGYASDPETQAVSGPNYLFDLNVTNSPTAQPGDLQLLTFDDLKLSDDWGDPVERISFDGGVHTIPFAYLEVSSITGPVCADPEDPLPFTVMLTALDWDGLPMLDCDVTVEFGTFCWVWPYTSDPVTPTSVALVGGSWSGEVALMEPNPGYQLFAHWGDVAGYSNWFQSIGKGDANADNRITIFDVVKVANMAIERGEWADWQWWAGDLNRDHEVNIFDVIQAANAAMDAMESMGIGRAGAPPVVAPPSEPVTVTTEVTESGGQVVVAVKLSNCAGLAGVQVELEYDGRKLTYSGVSAGELLTGASSWSVMGNDLGGRVKTIAYTASAEVLSGGNGTILTFTFSQTGKGKAKVTVTAVELADVEGAEIPSQTSGGKGGGKGNNK